MYRQTSLRVRLIVILLLSVTVPIFVTGYFIMNRAESALLNEKQAKLFGYARLLDIYLEGTYDDILAKEGALAADRTTKINILNRALRSYTDQVAAAHPGLGIGYYSKDLDAILTYGPSKEFGYTVGQSIFPGHQGYSVMATGKEMVQIGKLVRGPIMNCMVPIIRYGNVIGYIWANELLEDIDNQIAGMENKVYDTIIIGLFCALIISYSLTGNIARDVEIIKNGLKILHKNMSHRLPALRGEMGEIASAINEMADAMIKMKHHTENIVASTPNGLFTLNEQGHVTIYNLPCEQITGISPKDAIDNHYRHVFQQWPEIIKILDQTFEGELYQNKELTIAFNKRLIPLLMITSPLLNNSGEKMGILVIMRDLTDTKKLEEQVRRADRLAVVGELAAGVAHEVRNPLTAITGYLQLLAVDYDENDPRKEFTRIISKEIDRLNHLIEQLLYFSRPLPPQFILADIHKIIQETLLLIDNPTVRKKVTINTVFASNLPLVKVDPVQIKQVLLNIILNGLQAIESTGTLTLRTSFDEASRHVCIEIIDTGSGIPPENIPRLFDPFYTTKEKGTGLGLAVADKIMEVHQGYIEVASELGAGTCFSLYLPAKQEVKKNA